MIADGAYDGRPVTGAICVRMKWQQKLRFGLSSLAETGIARMKGLTGRTLCARTFGAQQKEVAIDISILKRQIRAAKPVTLRVK